MGISNWTQCFFKGHEDMLEEMKRNGRVGGGDIGVEYDHISLYICMEFSKIKKNIT